MITGISLTCCLKSPETFVLRSIQYILSYIYIYMMYIIYADKWYTNSSIRLVISLEAENIKKNQAGKVGSKGYPFESILIPFNGGRSNPNHTPKSWSTSWTENRRSWTLSIAVNVDRTSDHRKKNGGRNVDSDV